MVPGFGLGATWAGCKMSECQLEQDSGIRWTHSLGWQTSCTYVLERHRGTIVLKNLATIQLLVDGGLDNMCYIIEYYEAQKICACVLKYLI